ncbi:DNA repair protein RecO [Agathobaculum sp.]|uniref:DNA repair protein RecO n=1 Tax=Agathobaculum sp. TaxID=2048138 RepID=UPI002A80076B|nr:DNA repair protein RecO [Agathobaculum sp.]MDY3617530.1 DNA repair protein RecO [Agathobaculum sp.]
MAEVKLRALVLREVDFGDYDRYLTALSEGGRKIEILCKGVRRGAKQQIPAARQFCFSEFVLFERGGRYTLREADFVHSFWDLTQDIEAYALACYLAELAAALTAEDEDSPAVCRLLLLAFRALSGKKREGALVKASFEWRLMAESGYAPDLAVCGVCGRAVGQPPVCFSVRAGTAADEACARRIGGDYTRLADSALRALMHVLTCEPGKVYAFALTGPARAQFCALAEQYVLYHLGRGFDSLQFYQSIIKPIGAKK